MLIVNLALIFYMTNSQVFSEFLLKWHTTIERYLPWKEDKNVFYIWLSEVILQQTRVEQGIPYFLRFKERFNNVHELAAVSDEELMKLWEGLGYYSRARNLHSAAKQIVANGGSFPETYEGLLELKGIGPYTAAAIGSFAFDLPVPVIDGNVNRVVARYFSVTEAIDGKEGRQIIKKLVEKVFVPTRASEFNQAIMDFGAMQCVPKSPDCQKCVLNCECLAFNDGLVNMIPYKAKKVKKTNRTLHYILAEVDQRILIRKRIDKGIWRHLHEPVLFETGEFNIDNALNAMQEFASFDKIKFLRSEGPFKHTLTHQNLKVFFHHVEIKKLILENGAGYFLVDRENLQKFAFPKIIDWYLDEKSIYLKEF